MATELINGVYHVTFRENSGGGGGGAEIANDSIPAPQTLIRVDFATEDTLPTEKGTVIDGSVKVNFDGFVLEKYATLEVQGKSSASKPKKNFTFGLFNDAELTEEYKLRIGNMVPHSEFVYKANYGDAAQVRNVGCNKLWEQVIMAHDLPPYRGCEGVYKFDTGALCHVDGYPCVLYINNAFYGIGWWNIGKKRANYDMSKNNQNQLQLQAQPRVDLTGSYDAQYWEVRNPDTPDSSFAGKVNAWLTDNARTGSAFKENFATHHNVRNAIDYFIFVEFIYDDDGLDNNIMLTSWDGSEFWMLPYDLDSSLGLAYDGSYVTPYNSSVTETTIGSNILNANTRAFWRKFRDAYKAELTARYEELKARGIFTVANIDKIVSEAQKRYGQANFASEAAAWPLIPSLNLTSKMQILEWVKNRLTWMDSYYSSVPLESLAITGDSSVTGSGQYGVTYTPNDTTETGVVWSIQSGSEYASIDQSGLVTALTGASSNTVVIRATSAVDNTIYADKTITVTAAAAPIPLVSLSVTGDATVTGSGQYGVTYNPANTTETGVVWSIQSGSEYASIDQTGLVTALQGADSDTVVIRATSSVNSNIYADKTITVTAVAALLSVHKIFGGVQGDVITTEYQLFGSSMQNWTLVAYVPDCGGSTIEQAAVECMQYSSPWPGFTIHAPSNLSRGHGMSLAYGGSTFNVVARGFSTNYNAEGNFNSGNAAPIGISRQGNDLYYTIDGSTWVKFTDSVPSINNPLVVGASLYNGSYERIYNSNGEYLDLELYDTALKDCSSFFASHGIGAPEYTLTDHTCLGTEATAVNTGEKIFSATDYPNGFFLVLDFTPSDLTGSGNLHTHAGSQAVVSPFPGAVIRATSTANQLDLGGSEAVSCANNQRHRVVIGYDGSTLVTGLDDTTMQQVSQASAHDWPLCVGGALEALPGTWFSNRFAELVVHSLKVWAK